MAAPRALALVVALCFAVRAGGQCNNECHFMLKVSEYVPACIANSGPCLISVDRVVVRCSGVCEDGGPGSEGSLCALGTDCADCGERDGRCTNECHLISAASKCAAQLPGASASPLSVADAGVLSCRGVRPQRSLQ